MTFETDSYEFVNGVEYGMLWEKLSLGYTIDCRPIHNSNLTEVKKALNFFNYDWKIERFDDTWSMLRATPINPKGSQAPAA